MLKTHNVFLGQYWSRSWPTRSWPLRLMRQRSTSRLPRSTKSDWLLTDTHQVLVCYQYDINGKERRAFLVHCPKQHICVVAYASSILHAVETFRLAQPDCDQSYPFPCIVLHLLIREILACSFHVRANGFGGTLSSGSKSTYLLYGSRKPSCHI